jgi:hypothetical protein
MDTNPVMPQQAAISFSPGLSSLSDLFRRAIDFYKKHFVILATLTCIYFIANLLPYFGLLTSGKAGLILNPVLNLAGVILSFLTSVALLDTVVEDGMPQNGLSGAYKKGMTLIWAYFVTGFLSVLAVFGATLLLVVPGIIMGIMLGFSSYIVFAENKKGTAALIQSWYYVKGRAGGVFWRMLAAGFIVWFIIFIIIVALAMIFGWSNQTNEPNLAQSVVTTFLASVVEPLIIIYVFLIYKELKSFHSEPIAEEEYKSKKKKLIVLYVLGVVAVIALIVAFGYLIAWVLAHQEQLKVKEGVIHGIRYYVN